VDAATRTILVKANLPDSPGLRGGLTGRVEIEAPGRSSLWIPAGFLQQTSDIETVLVRSNDGWRRVLVKSGARQGDRIEILSGLSEGDEIGLPGEQK
jgi:multidrug efflux pump subunit AcrA (membrane-fusion protein)